MANPSRASSRSAAKAAASPLKRGKACLNCRYLKIKCDGKRPVCTPCESHPKDDECEYADGPRSRTKALEETIAHLKSRIHDLENPNETPAMQLQDPYSPSPSTSQPYLGPGSLLSPTSIDSPLPSTYSPSQASSGGSPRYPPISPFDGGHEVPRSPIDEEPPALIAQNLLDTFMLHAAEVGFFLNEDRFRASAASVGLPLGSHLRPCPSLLYAVYLWGSQFTMFHDVAQQRTFENKALQRIVTDLTSSHPHRVLHILQSNILLSYYFLRGAKPLEAKFFATCAINLALSAGLNGSSPATQSLAPPADSIESGERIDAFWSAFVLDRMVAIALQPTSSPNVCTILDTPGFLIMLPWSLDMDSYEKGIVPNPVETAEDTVTTFLHGSASSVGSDVPLSMLVKASTLLHRSMLLTYQWASDTVTEVQSIALGDSFKALVSILDAFKSSLPSLAHQDPNHVSTRQLFLVHSITEAAVITLHRPFQANDASFREKCLEAATAIVHPASIDFQQVAYINPLMGNLWSIAISVIMDEVRQLQYGHASPGHSTPSGHTEGYLQSLVQTGLTALGAFATNNAMIRECLIKSRGNCRFLINGVLPNLRPPAPGHSSTLWNALTPPLTPDSPFQSLPIPNNIQASHHTRSPSHYAAYQSQSLQSSDYVVSHPGQHKRVPRRMIPSGPTASYPATQFTMGRQYVST